MSLVLDTASLLDRELAASKVSLDLSLDEALPPILADRVQMQRVLVNLVINAIESLRAISDRPRRIAIRSALIDGKDVLLQVSDTGSWNRIRGHGAYFRCLFHDQGDRHRTRPAVVPHHR